MLEELKDARRLLEAATLKIESGNNKGAVKTIERTVLLLEKCLESTGTRFPAVSEEELKVPITKQDIIDGGVPK